MKVQKLDPSLLIEVERLKSDRQMDQEIKVLIRTKDEIGATKRAALEKKGAKVGSVIGDILTATVPARAISEIAALEFVLFIEKPKTLRLR